MKSTTSRSRLVSGQDGIIHHRYKRRSTKRMRCDSMLGQDSRNIREVGLNDFILALEINLSGRLGLEN